MERVRKDMTLHSDGFGKRQDRRDVWNSENLSDAVASVNW